MAAPTPSTAQALILAAGRGERMRPLTDTCPKPLLPVRGKPLMQWHMEALARGGCARTVVNTAWLGARIVAHFGAGVVPGQSIAYSREDEDFGHALETAGGIVRALPLLDEVFWVVAGDVFAPDFAFEARAAAQFAASGRLAHLWLVPNPPHHPRGDFGIAADGTALAHADTAFTYSTIGLYRRALFAPPYCGIPAGNPAGVAVPLAPLLRRAMEAGRVSAALYTGAWTDVGTPERLAALGGATA
ncbi:nucleotidyltransferase family protein [Ramlibacter sp. H39-3-26]|uniref:nucleotidyltransferase family protein n=1 Tax=Curvibacter soli TaxID=3031331 RepID=UPI0023DA9635|nr:nucleotidyltransferase family protein [Ramlibacter sp. H39-3-26]MDF1485583.1 nucleotidyltransferase family protein [Ramlibacter sp. H39-3-26]